jgi:hypothetical protein
MASKMIPTGGYGRADGVVLTKSQVTAAVQRYARRHGYYATTVRTVTVLFRAAMEEARP